MKKKRKLRKQGSAFSDAAFSSDEYGDDDDSSDSSSSSRRRRKRPRPQSRPGPLSERDWRPVLRLGRNLARKAGERFKQPSEWSSFLPPPSSSSSSSTSSPAPPPALLSFPTMCPHRLLTSHPKSITASSELMDLSNDERRLRAAIGKDRLRKFRRSFERADADDRGSLRQRDINEAFGDMGRRVNRGELRDWMDSKELEEDGAVNFAEFVILYAHLFASSGGGGGGAGGSDDDNDDDDARAEEYRRYFSRFTNTAYEDWADDKGQWREERWAKQVCLQRQRYIYI